MGLIKDLDVFVAFYEAEKKAKRIDNKDYKKIVKLVDTLQNMIEDLGY